MDGAETDHLALLDAESPPRRRVSRCTRLSTSAQACWQGIWNGGTWLWDGLEKAAFHSCGCISSRLMQAFSYWHMGGDGIYLVASAWKNAQTIAPNAYEEGIVGYQKHGWPETILACAILVGIWGLLAEKFKPSDTSGAMLTETDSTGDVIGHPGHGRLTYFHTSWDWMRNLFSALKNGRHAVINLAKAVLGIAGWTSLSLGATLTDTLGDLALISAGLYFINQIYRLSVRYAKRETPDPSPYHRHARTVTAIFDGGWDGLYVPGNIEIFASLFSSTMFAASWPVRALCFVPIFLLSMWGKVEETFWGSRTHRASRAWHVVRAGLNGAKNIVQAWMMVASVFLGRSMDDIAKNAFREIPWFGWAALLLAAVRATTSVITAFYSLRQKRNNSGFIPGVEPGPPGDGDAARTPTTAGSEHHDAASNTGSGSTTSAGPRGRGGSNDMDVETGGGAHDALTAQLAAELDLDPEALSQAADEWVTLCEAGDEEALQAKLVELMDEEADLEADLPKPIDTLEADKAKTAKLDLVIIEVAPAEIAAGKETDTAEQGCLAWARSWVVDTTASALEMATDTYDCLFGEVDPLSKTQKSGTYCTVSVMGSVQKDPMQALQKLSACG